MEVPLLVSRRTSILISTVAGLIFIPTNSVHKFLFSLHPHQHLLFFAFLIITGVSLNLGAILFIYLFSQRPCLCQQMHPGAILFFLFYSHVHTLFGSFLPPAPLPQPLPSSSLSCRQVVFCLYHSFC
jgi:uncharacterized membrane protein SpoIIM required for sporulation